MTLLDKLRRERPPDEVTSALHADDRLLTWSASDEGFIVATRRGMHLNDGRFLPWHRVDKAVWRDGVLSLTEAVEVAPGVMEALPPVSVPLAQPRNLPTVIQTRVTQSVAHTVRHTLPGGGAVRIVGRRIVGKDGLDWSLRYEGAADRKDAATQATAEQLLSETRAATSPSE